MNHFLHEHGVIYFHLILLIRLIMAALFVALAYWMAEHMSPEAAIFWKAVLSDSGNPSWSRVASSLLLIACVVWDTRFLFTTNALPDGGSLSAQALFISSPYLINTSGKAVMMGIAGKQSSPPPPVVAGDTTSVMVGK